MIIFSVYFTKTLFIIQQFFKKQIVALKVNLYVRLRNAIFRVFACTLKTHLNERHDTQHNDIQHYDAQHNDTRHNDTQHNDIQHNDS